MWAPLGHPMIRRSRACTRLRSSVAISRSQFFRFMALMRMAMLLFAVSGDFVPYHAYGGGGIRYRRRQWRGSARDQSDGICWQSVSLHQNSGHWIGPAQRVPRSPFIRLARAQEPRPDVYGAPTPRRHGRHLFVLLANLSRRRPYDRLLVSSAAPRIWRVVKKLERRQNL